MAEHSQPLPLDERDQQAREVRHVAREVFLHALGEASIPRAFERHVAVERGTLRVGEDLYDLSSFANVLVVAIGKAGHTMAEALVQQLGPNLTGVISSPVDPPHQLTHFRYYHGGHPLPNAESLLAARTILRALKNQTLHSLVIYLISGGGSSCVERPIVPTISLNDLAATYKTLVLSGAPIAEINAIRKHLSAVKGGRLAEASSPAQQVSIMISDVPEHQLDALASGPTMPDSSTVEDCYRIVKRYKMLKQFPPSVRELFEKQVLAETPKPGEDVFARSRFWPILSNSSAQAAAVAKAAMSGFAVEVDNSVDDWDYAKAADHLLKRLRKLRKGVSKACLISGGEVTVKVTGGGTGGRNQQFVLYCATKIAGENLCVMSAGTDGIDGNSPAAGAIADGTTVARARSLRLDPEAALAGFNSYPFFDRLGDSIMTGATGNNLRDLRILLAY